MKFGLKKYNNNTLGGLLIHVLLAGTALLVLAIVYFFVYLPAVTNKGESITVPNIEGLPIDKVQESLTRRDLIFEVNDSSYSAKYPPLTVLKQFPPPGAKVKEGRKVYVSINRVNPPTVPLPNLIDGSLINAEARLKANELKRGKIHLVRGPFLNAVTEMRVNGEKVEPNTRVPKGTVVDLVVMDGGSNRLSMPNVLGLPFDEAKFIITGSYLIAKDPYLVADTTNTAAIVLKQYPDPAETVKVGDLVELWIGPPGTELPDEDENDGQFE